MVHCRGPKGTGNVGNHRGPVEPCHRMCVADVSLSSCPRRRIIGEFCDDFGVPKQMKAALIKKAKFIGGRLGFLS